MNVLTHDSQYACSYTWLTVCMFFHMSLSTHVLSHDLQYACSFTWLTVCKLLHITQGMHARIHKYPSLPGWVGWIVHPTEHAAINSIHVCYKRNVTCLLGYVIIKILGIGTSPPKGFSNVQSLRTTRTVIWTVQLTEHAAADQHTCLRITDTLLAVMTNYAPDCLQTRTNQDL